MIKNFNTYKFISNLKYLRIIFLSFLFIFLANYMLNVCSSYLEISSNTFEISKELEGEKVKKKKMREKQSVKTKLILMNFIYYPFQN